MVAHIDEEALRSSLQRLRQAAFDADVLAVMKRTVNAVHGVFGYGGAGIMLITESGHLSYVAASDDVGRQLEQAQADAGQGPGAVLAGAARVAPSPPRRWPVKPVSW